jgi:hypothetical protein
LRRKEAGALGILVANDAVAVTIAEESTILSAWRPRGNSVSTPEADAHDRVAYPVHCARVSIITADLIAAHACITSVRPADSAVVADATRARRTPETGASVRAPGSSAPERDRIGTAAHQDQEKDTMNQSKPS